MGNGTQLHPPEPLQSKPPKHSSSGSLPFGMNAHVPRDDATSQRRHMPVHVVLQHTPSMQRLLRHSASIVHVAPSVPRHTPAPLHAIGATHVTGSDVPDGTSAHVPSDVDSEHVSHTSVHGEPQHTMSTQRVLVH